MVAKGKFLQNNKIKNSFLLTVTLIFLALDLSLAFFVISWKTPISVVLYLILSIFLFSFSLNITKRFFSLFLKPYKLYKLNYDLTTRPKVAIVYSTMNDVLPECLSIIDQSYPCDVFVLDDSTLMEKRQVIDKIVNDKGFKLLRRENREGFKAGAINNWIRLYGKNYDYFVLLDSDSFIPRNWVENTLKYAENPLNSKVAIFQGLINIWNLDNKFIRTSSSLHRIGQDVWELKLANYLDAVFCYGHNVMIRMKPVLEIGGFVEGFVSEDFATAVKIAEKGFKCRFVPLHTYEAMPENIRGFIKRQYKWTRGSIEFLSLIKSPSLSITQKILLFSIPLGHFAYIAILAAMFLTVFGYMTTFGNLYTFLQNLIFYNIFFIWSIPIFRFAITIKIISMTLNILKFRQLDISFYDSMKHEILSKAIGAIMLPYEVSSIIRYLINRKLQWPVTPKHENRLNLKDILLISKITIILSLMFVLGLWFINPLGLIFNVSWLIPFVLAPITLYFFSNDMTKISLKNDGGVYSDKGIFSEASQSKEVYSFIRKAGLPIVDLGLSAANKKIVFTLMMALLVSLSGLFAYEAATAFFIYQPTSMPPEIQGNITVCGNGFCEIGENSATCPGDCLETVPTTIKGGVKLDVPTVTGPRSNSKEIYIDDIVKLSVYAEKLGEADISKVWAIVKFPSGKLETVELSSNGVWSGSIKVKENGIYLATFNALDESNAYADPIAVDFKVKINSPLLGGGIIASAGIPPSAY